MDVTHQYFLDFSGSESDVFELSEKKKKRSESWLACWHKLLFASCCHYNWALSLIHESVFQLINGPQQHRARIKAHFNREATGNNLFCIAVFHLNYSLCSFCLFLLGCGMRFFFLSPSEYLQSSCSVCDHVCVHMKGGTRVCRSRWKCWTCVSWWRLPGWTCQWRRCSVSCC